MLKVAILDDYQNVSQQFVDLEKLSGKYEIKIFSEPFENEDDLIDKLSDFEALLVMRERTPMTKNIIESLTLLSKGEEIDMPELLIKSKQSGYKVKVCPIHEYWIDVGRPESLKQAHEEWNSHI